jgi:MFS family permease
VIPERFQLVNGESVLMAGVHILPLLGACAIGSFLGGAISSRKNNTSITLVIASCFQLLGVGLMMLATSPDSKPEFNYGFQAIFGLGVGLSLSAATIMTNITVLEETGRAAAQGAIAQARVLGGCIGLSVCTVTFNTHVNKYLVAHLTRKELEDLHRSPLSGLQLPGDLRDLVKDIYSGAFSEEIKIMTIVCAVMVLISLFTLERHPAPLERFTEYKKDCITSRRGSDSGIELKDLRDNGHSF